MRTALLLVLPIVALVGCNILGDKPYANGTPDPPVCKEGCEPNTYYGVNGVEVDCDPIDPSKTPPGYCMPWDQAVNCFKDGTGCGQDAWCCSGNCIMGTCGPWFCKQQGESCVTDANCCSGLKCVPDAIGNDNWCQ